MPHDLCHLGCLLRQLCCLSLISAHSSWWKFSSSDCAKGCAILNSFTETNRFLRGESTLGLYLVLPDIETLESRTLDCLPACRKLSLQRKQVRRLRPRRWHA